MTNREWLAQHPEKISSRILQESQEWWEDGIPDEFKSISKTTVLDLWLNAPHKEPETTVTTTFEVTEIYEGETPTPQKLRAVAESRAEIIKSMSDTADVKVAKIRCLLRGGK